MVIIRTLNPTTGRYESKPKAPTAFETSSLIEALANRIKALETAVWALQQVSTD